MDPLSITASAIAVIGALSASGKGIGKLIALKHAPEELLELSNEVESLRLLVTQVKQSFLSTHGLQVRVDHGDAVENLLERMRRPVEDLNAVIEYRLQRIDTEGASSTLSKKEWLKAGPAIEKHRRRILEAANQLNLAMTATTLQQQALQIQSISLVSQDLQNLQLGVHSSATGNREENADLLAQATQLFSRLDEITSKVEGSPLATSSGRVNERGSCTLQSNGTPEHQPANSTTLRTRRNSDLEGRGSVVRLTATTIVRTCRNFCRCQCHVATHIQTPRMLRNVLGQLFFTYTGLLRPTPCNYPPCAKGANKSTFLYHFPTWLAARALMITGYARDLMGPESDWALRIPIVIPYSRTIWHAVKSGDAAFLKSSVAAGQSLRIIDEDGWNLATVAIMNGQHEILRYLLDQIPDAHVENDADGLLQTLVLDNREEVRLDMTDALNYTIEDIVELLSFTRLHAAAAMLPGYDRLTTEILEQAFQDVNMPDRTGKSPLHWACARSDASTVELLLRWKANPDAKDRQGDTCLHEAVRSRDVQIAQALIDAGCNLDLANRFGNTAIFLASDLAMLELLIRHGANLYHRDRSERSPLHNAVSGGTAAVAIELVSLGADVYDVDYRGSDSLMLATLFNRPYTLQALVQATDTLKPFKEPRNSRGHVYGRNSLHIAGGYAGIEVMHVLMGVDLEGLDPAGKDRYGDTPTDSFYLYRDDWCTFVRPPFEEEEELWWDLMETACRDNDIDFETFEPGWREKFQANRRRVVEVDSEDEGDEHGEDGEMDEDPASDGYDEDDGNDAKDGDDGDDEFVDAVEAQQA